MSLDLWDLHDVIGSKPAWYYAKCLDDYMMSSYKPPVWLDDDDLDSFAETLFTACQTDFSDATKDSEQSAEEAVPRRAPPLERTLSIGTTAPHPPVRPAFGRWRSLSTF